MEVITSLISAILGGIVATILKTLLEKKKDIEISYNKLMEEKYRSLLVFMACALDIKNKRFFTLQEQHPNTTTEDYVNLLKEYYYQSVLYSSDNVILAIKEFINNPTKQQYINVAKEMRIELWGKSTNLSYDSIVLTDSGE